MFGIVLLTEQLATRVNNNGLLFVLKDMTVRLQSRNLGRMYLRHSCSGSYSVKTLLVGYDHGFLLNQ